MTNRVAVVLAFLAGAVLVALCVVAYGPANPGPALAEKKAMLRQLATTSMLSGTHTVMGRSDFRSDALLETGHLLLGDVAASLKVNDHHSQILQEGGGAGSAMVGSCDLASDSNCTIRGVRFELYAPVAGCSAQAPCGLILDVPGFSMSGTNEVKNSKMDELGPAAGYIVAAPTSPDTFSYHGPPFKEIAGAADGCISEADYNAFTHDIDDAPSWSDLPAYVTQDGCIDVTEGTLLFRQGTFLTWVPANGHQRLQGFLEDASAADGVDSDRVHVMGFSQGGFATWSLLCRASTVVCSIAPLANSGLDPWGAGYGSTCFDNGAGPAVHRPIFYTTGRQDPLAAISLGHAQRDFVLTDYGMQPDASSTTGAAGYEQHVQHSAGYSTHIWGGPDRTTFRMDVHDSSGNLYFGQGGHCFPRTGSDCHCPPNTLGTCTSEDTPWSEPCHSGPQGHKLYNFGCCSSGDWPTEALAFFAAHPCSWRPPAPPTAGGLNTEFSSVLAGPGYRIDEHPQYTTWRLVRRVKAGTTWHPATDHCLGSEEYNTNIPFSQLTNSEADVTWSIKWDTEPYDQILFASGDAQHWLITTKEAVGAVNNQYYSNAQRDIIKSSDNDLPYTAAWYNRAGALEDPWISVNDHGGAIADGKIVYGENSFNWPSHNDLLEDHNGANVFIRTSLHPQ